MLTNQEQEQRKIDQEQQREAARQEHNARTDGAVIEDGELEDQRLEHNRRTGGYVPEG